MIKISDKTKRYVSVSDTGQSLGGVSHLTVYLDGKVIPISEFTFKGSTEEGGLLWVFIAPIGSEIAFTSDLPAASDGIYYDASVEGVKFLDQSGAEISIDYQHATKFKVYGNTQIYVY